MGMTHTLRGTANELRWREGARAWLARHRLPMDEATVGFVAERLRARRRWRRVSTAALCTIVVLLAWLLGRYEVGDDAGFVSLVAVVAAVVGGDVVRRRLLWHRWDRRLIAAQSVRVAMLNPPSWEDLVGPRALRRAAVLLGAGLLLVLVALPVSGPSAAGQRPPAR
jgi:hypothetical protein